MQVNNKRWILMGVNFIKIVNFGYIKIWKNQITVENNNIITLNPQIVHLWHVKEKYYFMKLSKIYLTCIYCSDSMYHYVISA